MQNKFSLLLIAAVTLLFSCKKDDNSPTSTPISGNYAFVNIAANTNAIITFTQGGDAYKNISISDYTSHNNKGTVTIDGSHMNSSNLSYDVDTTVSSTTYVNGVSQGTYRLGLNFSAPASNSTSGYKLLGTDSIAFFGNVVTMPGSGPSVGQASGGRYKWSGDTLIITSKVNASYDGPYQGVPAHTDESIIAVMRFLKS